MLPIFTVKKREQTAFLGLLDGGNYDDHLLKNKMSGILAFINRRRYVTQFCGRFSQNLRELRNFSA